MHAHFLLGPAGTGKTFRCLEEISQALREDPSGPPLVLLAPKQATYQLERQLLAQPDLAGYTRLHIFSFERLSEFLLDTLRCAAPALLSEEGRGMVLHALSSRRRERLQIFHASAGLAGFSRQLSQELRELQRQGITPEKLRALAGAGGRPVSLQRKLHDLALLLTDYLAWLEKNQLQDADCLLPLAAEALSKSSPAIPFIDSLWLDGFADLTAQELALLAALAPRCQKMTIAFCLDQNHAADDTSWLSLWSGVSATWRRCWGILGGVTDVKRTVELLPRHGRDRFAHTPALGHLEKFWIAPAPFTGETGAALRLASCESPAEEADMAAHEILSFIRSGGRYRQVAVLVRNLADYHEELRRVLTRYEIPFFLDRRQPVSHHPLAELTRNAVRAAARGWPHDDWFGILKSGLVTAEQDAVDHLENIALENGWNGEMWFAPFRADFVVGLDAEKLRAIWTAPFTRFRQKLAACTAPGPDGPALAGALRDLWTNLGVEKKLEQWSREQEPGRALVHASIWTQMEAWLDDIELAFAGTALTLAEWLPILDAGLGALTVGVIPPVLDQVLIGAVDRSRNPEIQLAIVLGVNEKVFPAAPSTTGLLSQTDRAELQGSVPGLAQGEREFLSREQFLGYIAFTRSSARLVASHARRDGDGHELHPSWFMQRLQTIFPQVTVESYVPPSTAAAEHWVDLIPALVAAPENDLAALELLRWPALAPLAGHLQSLRATRRGEHLPPETAARLYGNNLRVSVSRLERYAACAFRFFVDTGLRAEERKLFQLDRRERGSFQHAALSAFHQELQREKKQWRDVSPADARLRMGRIVTGLGTDFRQSLMQNTAQSRFSVNVLSGSLQDLVEAMVRWMSQYEFNPHESELAFGQGGKGLPAWELDLGEGKRLIFNGVIDRVDLHRLETGEEALAVVIDYKSSERKPDALRMQHGLELQLTAYMSVLRQSGQIKNRFGVERLVPVGIFYVNLKGKTEAGSNRSSVRKDAAPLRQNRYQHFGRFDWSSLPHLDNRGEPRGTQFNYRLIADGTPHSKSSDILSAEKFAELLDQVEKQLVRMGREIFQGEIAVNPFQKGKDRACDECLYQGICRFDPWIQPYRALTAQRADEAEVRAEENP